MRSPETGPLRIAFAGSPEFARKILGDLASRGDIFEIAGVWTQPPRARGRGMGETPTPVAVLAEERGLPLRQPLDWNPTESEALRACGVDYLVTCAYGLILPVHALSAPRVAAVNVHTSLLPRWRGAAPVQRALEAGDTETGVTIFVIEEKLDTGPILAQEPMPIGPDDTLEDLLDRMSGIASELLLSVLPAHKAGQIVPVEQEDGRATYARKLRKEEGTVAWTLPAVEIARKARAFHPWPGVRVGELKIIRTRVVRENGTPGEILSIDPLIVATSRHALQLETVQRSGGRPVSGADFARGRRLRAGDRLP